QPRVETQRGQDARREDAPESSTSIAQQEQCGRVGKAGGRDLAQVAPDDPPGWSDRDRRQHERGRGEPPPERGHAIAHEERELGADEKARGVEIPLADAGVAEQDVRDTEYPAIERLEPESELPAFEPVALHVNAIREALKMREVVAGREERDAS